jgi:RimJ/RimL family protein N-acetyltransferase
LPESEGPYLHWFDDPLVTQYLETTGRQTPVTLAAFINRCNASETDLLLGLFLKENDRHIGNIKLGPIYWRHQRAGIGILIGARESWHQGFAREAIVTIASFAFKDLKLRKLVAGCYAPNSGSRRAFAAAGFHEEAARKSHACLQNGSWVDVVEMARFRSDIE